MSDIPIQYYVETRQNTGHCCCYENRFHYDVSFETLDDAKAWVPTIVDTNDKECSRARIYKCKDNVVIAILFSNDYGTTWKFP